MITKTIKGNLITMALNGEFDVIMHGCNCFNTMGAGIAKEIKQRIPIAYEVDCATEKGSYFKLGDYSLAFFHPKPTMTLEIINAYIQYTYWEKSPIEYSAVKDVFIKLNKQYTPSTKFGIPKIGGGLAGGDWEIISKIINTVTPDINITLVEYE